MSRTERLAIIADLVRSAPRGLGLPDAARRNLEALDDEALVEFQRKVAAVRAHSADAVGDGGVAGVNARSGHVARRGKLYEQLRAVGRGAGPAGAAAAVAGDAAGADAPAVPARTPPLDDAGPAVPARTPLLDDAALAELLAGGVALPSSVRLWNAYERGRDDRLTERLTRIVFTWLLDFEKLTFDHHIQRSFASSLMERTSLKEELAAYFDIALDRIGRDTLRIVRHHVRHADPAELESMADRRMVEWLLKDRALSSTSFDLSFYSTSKGMLPNGEAMDGLAKMRAFALDYDTDAVVSLGGGGKMVGDFLAVACRLPDARSVSVSLTRGAARFAGGRGALAGARRILLVDDVVSAGGGLSRAYAALKGIDPSAEVRIVALVGTAGARGGLMDEHRSAFVPNVTIDDEVTLPWARSGVYRHTSGRHTFGLGSERPWSVANSQLNQLGVDLASQL